MKCIVASHLDKFYVGQGLFRKAGDVVDVPDNEVKEHLKAGNVVLVNQDDLDKVVVKPKSDLELALEESNKKIQLLEKQMNAKVVNNELQKTNEELKKRITDLEKLVDLANNKKEKDKKKDGENV